MPGVKVVDQWAFWKCEALTIVECGKLERIRGCAFDGCISLRNINLPSIKIVEGSAFCWCKALMTVKFGDKLKTLNGRALYGCRALERIAIPLKDGMITHDNIFTGCEKMKHVDLVEEELHETIDALQMEEWKKDMRRKIDALNQILPTTPAGSGAGVGGKADAIRTWITNVLRNIIEYKAQHQSYLNEAATTLQLALPSDIVIKCGADIVMKNVLPFLELPPYTFGGED